MLADRYELLEEIGRGAMGIVHRARDRETGREVAVKSLHGMDPDDLYRLKNEFRALSGVLHPNLIRLHELTVEERTAYFTMEFVAAARTIVDVVAEAGRSDLVIRGAFRQLAAGLAALHAAGWLHRDIKPPNVLVDAGGRVYLLDFGLVRAVGSDPTERTQLGVIAGTFAYMSPEQALGRPLTAASDWYSFGILLFECLTGRSPFAGARPAALLDRASVSIPSASQVMPGTPADLDALVRRLLAPDPLARPALTEVQAVLGGEAPIASGSVARDTLPFVGRATALAGLQRAWAATRAGAVAVACIEGASGLGKTTLAERFLANLSAQGALVLRARCHPHELVPFEALDEVIDDLSRYLSSLSAERLDALLPHDTDALQRVFPVLGRLELPRAPLRDRGALAEPHEIRRRGFEALRELFSRLADRRSLVISIDDLQWGDSDSVPLLREMLRGPDAPSALWLFSFRTEDRSRSPLLQQLEALLELVPAERRISVPLEPLGDDEAVELVDSLWAGALPPEASLALVREARGSPFLLSELSTLRGIEPIAGASAARLDEVIQRRLAELPDEARRLLEALSLAASPLDRSVALDAAGLDDLAPRLGALLERGRLLRPAAGSGARRLEIYHDQIREAIERRLPAEARVRSHAALADALERRGSCDPAALYHHHAGAGHSSAAARYAVAAGDQAAEQLAFDHAARFFAAALEHDRSAIDVPRTRCALAESLANAGRGPAAARAFEEAAAMQADAAAEELQQRAAEQYLVCGRLEDGRRVIRSVFARMSVRYPSTSTGALAGIAARLPGLVVRYLRDVRHPAGEITGLDLRVDACHRAARGLMMVDPPRAAYFAVRSLADALRGTDGFRIGRALAAVGGALVPLGGWRTSLAHAMLARAERIAADVGDARLHAMLAVSQAQAAFVGGRFAEMLARCDHAAELFVRECRGVRWDCDVAHMGGLRALEEMGRFPEIGARLQGLTAQAVDLEDLYAEVTFRLHAAMHLLAAGKPEEARAEAREAIRRWGDQNAPLQQFYALRIECLCDLYEGRPDEAHERLERSWRELRRSGLFVHRMVWSDGVQLRARVALASRTPEQAWVQKDVAGAARDLRRLARTDAEAAAATFEAAMAHRAGDRGRAGELLLRAAALHHAAGMPLHRACVDYRRSELLGGEEGAALAWTAERTMVASGITDVERWLSVQAPGFTGTARPG